MTKRHLEIISHVETYMARGETPLGVGWPRLDDAERRYDAMLGLIRLLAPEPVSLLDFGCGMSHLYDHIRQRGLEHRIAYCGLDLSSKFLAVSRRKYPGVRYYQLDLLAGDEGLPAFDYIVMNGIFTQKCGASYEEMLAYLRELVVKAFAKCREGIAFNVMSKQVDWERDDLFHLPLNVVAEFLAPAVSRHFVIRHDYLPYEYTVYVYR